MANKLVHKYEKEKVCIQVFEREDGSLEINVLKPSEVELYCNFDKVDSKNIDRALD